MPEVKILVSGDANGQFRRLFAKVNAIIKKNGDFEYLFCLGNFFGSEDKEWEELRSGKIKVPLTTYILGPNVEELEEFYNSEYLAPNIIHLGRSGRILGSSGLRIAYLSGLEQPEDKLGSSTKRGIYFSQDDVNNLISTSSGSVTDILLTSAWPVGVDRYAPRVKLWLKDISSGLITQLAKELKPRFHFTALADYYYERIPYRNHKVLQEQVLHTTRFYSLACVNNVEKIKWMYAFKTTPAVHMPPRDLAEVNGPTTKCPYDSIFDLNAERQQNEFFFGRPVVCPKQKRIFIMDKPDAHQAKKQKTIDSQNCWFCLGNPGSEIQLVISLGVHCYISLAKGILVPEHVLIIPIKHAVSSVELSNEVLEEIDNYKKSLINYFHDKNMDVVFFERNYFSPHVQIQVVPVPKKMKFKIHETLLALAGERSYDFAELPCLACVQKVVSKTKPFFYFEIIVDRKTEAKYLHMINKKFPLQFGRTVLGHPKVLNVPHRIDWRHCGDSYEVEKDMTLKMKHRFLQYDITKMAPK